MIGFKPGKKRNQKRIMEAQSELEGEIDRLSAKISQVAGQRNVMIKRAASAPPHERQRIAGSVKQLDRQQERDNQRLQDLQRQQNIFAERLSHFEQEKTDFHRKNLSKLVGDPDDLVMDAQERALESEEDRALLHDVDQALDATASGPALSDQRVDSIMEEIEAQKEILEDERSGRIKARLDETTREERAGKAESRIKSEKQEEQEETY